jgi:hypothetical protein
MRLVCGHTHSKGRYKEASIYQQTDWGDAIYNPLDIKLFTRSTELIRLPIMMGSIDLMGNKY